MPGDHFIANTFVPPPEVEDVDEEEDDDEIWQLYGQIFEKKIEVEEDEEDQGDGIPAALAINITSGNPTKAAEKKKL